MLREDNLRVQINMYIALYVLYKKRARTHGRVKNLKSIKMLIEFKLFVLSSYFRVYVSLSSNSKLFFD